MAGPDEVDPAELDPALLEVPLDYPPVESHGGPLIPVQAPGGPKAITPKDVALKDLGAFITFGSVSIHQTPAKPPSRTPTYLVPFHEEIIGYFHVYYKDAAGAEQPWPENKIKTMFGGDEHRGSSRFTFRAPSQSAKPVPIIFQAEVLSKPQRWKFQEIHRGAIQGYCGVRMSALSSEEQVLAQALFAEGGSMASFSLSELHAVAWTLRNRVDFIKQAVAQNSQSLLDTADASYKTKKPTYSAVILATGAVTGVGKRTANFKMAQDPAGKIPDRPSCELLQQCMDVASGVIAGSIPDPYAGQGHPNHPGSFYYITKEERAKRVKANDLGPTWDRPSLPPLGPNDKHLYYAWLPR